MKHLHPHILTQLALGEAPAETTASARDHLEVCSRCRLALERTERTWNLLAADPAASLPDLPVWPRVAAALHETGRPAPALVPRWRVALAEARRRPLAYAFAALLIAGLAGGNLVGRTLFDAAAASTTSTLVQYSGITGLPEGSLAAGYLGSDFQVAVAGAIGESGR